MPYSVQPPLPPAIVKNLQPAEAPVTRPAESSTRTLLATALPVPTPPETSAPEPPPWKAAKSAALLGSPISVGHPILPADETVSNGNSRYLFQPPTTVASRGGLISSSSTPKIFSAQQTTQESVGSNQDKALLTTSNGQVSGKWENNQQLKRDKRQLPAVTRLLAQERGGEVREFDVSPPSSQEQPLQKQETAPPVFLPQTGQPQSPPAPQQIPPAAPGQTGQPQSPPAPQQIPPTAPPQTPQPQPGSGTGGKTPAAPITPSGLGGIVELTADRQEYDVDRQIVTAEGNVLIRFQNGVVDADRVQVNLSNRVLVAQGNVALRRGQQVLRGERLEYYFVQDNGVLLNASGEIYQPRAGADLTPTLPNDVGSGLTLQRPLSDRIIAEQPQQQVTNPGGIGFVVGAGRDFQNLPASQRGGTINRYRFQAERVNFDSEGWRATNVRITNDPFSPPELEIRADTARFRQIEPLVSEITTTRSRLVFDQGLSVPIFQDRRLIDRRPRDPSLVSFGYDGNDRSGLFAQRTFTVIDTPKWQLRLTPQYLLQRAVGLGNLFNSTANQSSIPQPKQGNPLSPSVFGLIARLDGTLSPRTTLNAAAVFPSLDRVDIERKARASLRLRQTIGTTLPHTLNLEYSYRDRLFNGSLGFQTVQSSLGAVLTSPIIPIGKTGINLTYQGGLQYINADTDRLDLLAPVRTNNRVTLTRYQASASLSRGFLLWQGQGLPATATEGLRYTPVPVVPYLQVTAGITGVGSGYSSGDTQTSLSGNIGLQGQFGHFSRPFLDYTGFNIGYSQILGIGSSPFLFDRLVDNSVLSAGITQQIYGPFRLGFQTYISLDTGREISTDYFLEYSRRTYDIILRYNPVLAIGSISLRVNDFNWLGNAEPFDGTGIRPVVQGVTR